MKKEISSSVVENATNSKVSWTPGPWIAKRPETNPAYGVDKGWLILAVDPMRGVINSQITGLNEANARLIAAAPEMGMMLLSIFSHISHGGPTREEAEALLKKAGLL